MSVVEERLILVVEELLMLQYRPVSRQCMIPPKVLVYFLPVKYYRRRHMCLNVSDIIVPSMESLFQAAGLLSPQQSGIPNESTAELLGDQVGVTQEKQTEHRSADDEQSLGNVTDTALYLNPPRKVADESTQKHDPVSEEDAVSEDDVLPVSSDSDIITVRPSKKAHDKKTPVSSSSESDDVVEVSPEKPVARSGLLNSLLLPRSTAKVEPTAKPKPQVDAKPKPPIQFKLLPRTPVKASNAVEKQTPPNESPVTLSASATPQKFSQRTHPSPCEESRDSFQSVEDRLVRILMPRQPPAKRHRLEDLLKPREGTSTKLPKRERRELLERLLLPRSQVSTDEASDDGGENLGPWVSTDVANNQTVLMRKHKTVDEVKFESGKVNIPNSAVLSAKAAVSAYRGEFNSTSSSALGRIIVRYYDTCESELFRDFKRKSIIYRSNMCFFL